MSVLIYTGSYVSSNRVAVSFTAVCEDIHSIDFLDIAKHFFKGFSILMWTP